MGAAASTKYAVRPFTNAKGGGAAEESGSTAIVAMLGKSVRATKKQAARARHYALTEEMAADVAQMEDAVYEKLSGNWLKSIAAPAAYKLFKDPEQMFLTRPQRLKLENLVHAAYMSAEDEAGRASKPAPFWSLVYTDTGMLEFPVLYATQMVDGVANHKLDFKWDGPTSRRQNREELARHEGGALRTEHYFMTRKQRRELELQVELGFKREKPHVRMPQLSLKYTDKTLLDLANTMDNILFTGPRKPPAGTAAGGKDGAEAGGQQVGPASAASFEIFLDPIIAEYFRALPAMGAVVTMVKEDNQGVPQIFYTQGFGINGRVDKLAKAELAAQKRAVVEAQKQAVRDRKAARQAAKDAKAKAKAEAIAAVAEKARLEAMARAGFRTPEQIAKAKSIKQLFRSIDSDGSGYVDVDELRGGMAAFGLDPEDPLFVQVMLNADEDGDGEVTLEEFMQAMEGDEMDEGEATMLGAFEQVAEENPFRRRIRSLFAQLDDDNSGWVSRDEIIEGMDRAGLDIDPDAVEDLLVEADADGDGQVTVDELIKAFEQVEKDTLKQAHRDARTNRRLAKLESTNRGRAEKLFKGMDKRGRGFIDAKQLYDGLWRAGFAGANAAHVKNMMRLGDKNRDGQLTLDEFLLCFQGIEEDVTESESSSSEEEGEPDPEPEVELTPSEAEAVEAEAVEAEAVEAEHRKVQEMFEEVDEDRSGSLDKDEIYMLIRTLGLMMSARQLDLAMAEMDADGSGQVMLDEFDDWWMAQRESSSVGLSGGIFASLRKGLGNLAGARGVGNALGAKDRAGVLHVGVAGARRLPVMESGGADPYCTLEFEGASYRTKTRKNTLAPKWEETFKFAVNDRANKMTLFVLDSDLDADDLVGRVTFAAEEVLTDEGKMTGEHWWPIRPARGGLVEAQMVDDINTKKTEVLRAELVERGMAKDKALDMTKKEMRAALLDMGLGEVRLRCVFRPEGQYGWEDDGDGGSSSDEEEEMWQNISDHIGTGRRPLDCMVKFIYRDTTGAELPEDYWTEEEEAKLEAGVKRFAEPVSPEFTLIPAGGVSRVVTAIAALQLVEQGLLDIQTDVSSYSDLDIVRHLKATITGRDHDTDTPVVTVEHILTNRSGLDHKWTGTAGHGQQYLGKKSQASCFQLCCAGCGLAVVTIVALAALANLLAIGGSDTLTPETATAPVAMSGLPPGVDPPPSPGSRANSSIGGVVSVGGDVNTTAAVLAVNITLTTSWSGSGSGSGSSSSWAAPPQVVDNFTNDTNSTNFTGVLLPGPSACAARSCAGLGWPAATRGGWWVCGESDGGFDCIEEATAAEAQATCAGVGARLCTAYELEEGAGVGTGCGHDNRAVWSESSRADGLNCEAGEQVVVWWWAGGNGGNPGRCTPAGSTAAVRCCGDVTFDVGLNTSVYGAYSQVVDQLANASLSDCDSLAVGRSETGRAGMCCFNSSVTNTFAVGGARPARADGSVVMAVDGASSLAEDEAAAVGGTEVLSALYLVAIGVISYLMWRRHLHKSLELEGTSLEAAAAAAMSPDEIGRWVEDYFPHVVQPPGSVPGCPLYGYALLGHVIELLSHRRFWHYTHEKIFQPLNMIASSFGGAHLPSIGPDPLADKALAGLIEQRGKVREAAVQDMAAKVDLLQAEMLRKEKEKDAAMAETDAVNPMYFSNTHTVAKLEAAQVEQAERYEELEKERAADELLAVESAARRLKELQNLANDKSQLRPAGWHGPWPPKRWIGHTSHQPWLPTELWQRGPRKWRHPDRAVGPFKMLEAAVVIWANQLRAWVYQMAAAWQRLLRPESPIGFGGGGGGDGQPAPARRRLLPPDELSVQPEFEAGTRGGVGQVADDAANVMAFIEAGITDDMRPPEPPPPPPGLIPLRQEYHRCPSLAPANGMHTTGRDIGKLMCMLLADGQFKKRTMLQPTTIQAGFATAWQAHPALSGDTLLGMAEWYHGAERVLLCDGGDPGAGSSTCMLLIPERRIGLFVAFNCYGRGAAAVRPNLAERFLDEYFSVPGQSAAVLEAERAAADLAEQNRQVAAMDRPKQANKMTIAVKPKPEPVKPKKKKVTFGDDNSAAANARWHANHFDQYAAAVKSNEDNPDGLGGAGDPDEMAKILAAARPQEGVVREDGPAEFEAWRYVGTYMTTLASVSTIDALRGFEGQIRIGVDRHGQLYLRRVVDPASHLFRRVDRPVATGPLGERLAEDGPVGAGASFVAFGVGWDGRGKYLFLTPSRLAFRRISWAETLGPTVVAFALAACTAPAGLFLWIYVAPAGDGRGHARLPWEVDWHDTLKHESIPREFCGWLLTLTLGAVAFTAVGFAVLLPYGTHSGAPDQWAVHPAWYVRGLLLGVLGTILLGKGLVLATLYVWLQEWWLPWERAFFTATSIGLVPWVLLLSRWNLVLFKY